MKINRRCGFLRAEMKMEIKDLLHAHMLDPDTQRAPFLVTIRGAKGIIWNGHTLQGGLIVEGARPLSANTTDTETKYTLTNGDSGYTRPIGTIKLSEIEYVEVLMPR